MKIQFLFFIYHCCNLFFFLLLLIVIYSEEPPRRVNKLLNRTTLRKRINDRIITLSDTKKMKFQKCYLLNHKLSTVALTNIEVGLIKKAVCLVTGKFLLVVQDFIVRFSNFYKFHMQVPL